MSSRVLFPFLVSILCISSSISLVAEDDVVTELTSKVEDIAVADSGQILVLKLQGQKGLTIYDTRTQKLKVLELPAVDFAFGAGGDTAVVFLKERNEISSYSLKTMALVKAKEFVDPIDIMRITMGHSRSDLAFVRIAREIEALSNTSNHFVDVTTLTLIKSKGQQNQFGRNNSYRDTVHFRANGDMSRMTEWATSHSPTGIYLFTSTEDGYRLQGNHDSAGHLAIGDDGRIYSGFGEILDLLPPRDGHFSNPIGSVGKISEKSLFAGIGGLFFLGMQSDGGLNLYQVGETTALCPLASFPGWTLPSPRENVSQPLDPMQPPGMLEQFVQGTLTLDKRIVFSPAAGHLVFLPPTNDRLIHRKFDLKSTLDKTGRDYLLTISNPPTRSKAGAHWDYQVSTLAKYGPVKFRLDKSPEGMSMSPTGALKWKIPGGIQGKTQVVVAVTDSKANMIRHSFTISFE